MRWNRFSRVVTLAGLAGSVAASLWAATASASTTFPQAVDDHLKLTGNMRIEVAVAPPDGCLLCHMTEAGGFGTNNAFGTELRMHGAVGAEPSTVGPALDSLEASDPHSIDDISMGINPNNDHSMPIAVLPQPEYGCTMTAPSGRETDVPAAFIAALVGVALLRTGGRGGRRSGASSSRARGGPAPAQRSQ
jgi:hypothetical protein